MRMFVVCVTIVLCLAGVFNSQAGEQAEKPVTCRLAYSARVYYAPQILASRKGWFRADGVDVKDVNLGMSGGIAGAEALVSGSADVVVMGDVPAVLALASKRECVLIASYGGGERMHRIITTKSSGIKTAKDLEGKRLGVQFGVSVHGAVLLYLKHNGVDTHDVKIINIPMKDLADALSTGQLDALAASEPIPTLALSKVKDTVELATLSGLSNNYPLVIMSTREFAEAHPKAVSAIVEGTRRGVELINKDPVAAAAELSKVTGVPADIECSVLKLLEWRVSLDKDVVASLEQTAAFMQEQGKLKRIPDVKNACMGNFAQQTLQAKDPKKKEQALPVGGGK